MKKLIIFLVIAIGAFAETVSVDLDFLLKSHPKTATVKKEIQNKKVALEKDLNTKGTKLKTDYETLVKKGTKITDADKESFAKRKRITNIVYKFSKATFRVRS